MGCCLSRTTKVPPPTPTPHLPRFRNPTSSRRDNLRQPPTVEEETVKEVLTETQFAETPNKDNEVAIEKKGLESLKTLGTVVEVKRREQEQEQRVERHETEIQSSDIEVSEITAATENRSRSVAAVSVSESVSAATVNGEKKGGGGGEEVMSKSRDRADVTITRRQRSTEHQSPAKALKRRPYSGEQPMTRPSEKRVRSPAKKTIPGPAPSPEKKTLAASRAAARGRSQSPATTNPRSGMNAGPARIRRDSGERSGRRSRSPARNLSHNTNRAGALNNVNAKVNLGHGQHEEARRTGTVEEEVKEACPPADESLENPLVSLECFIFL